VCLRVMEIRTDSFTVRQDTTFNDGAPDTDYLQPSLRPDRDGNLLLVFHTRSDSNVVGVRATGRLATDALDTLQPSIEVRAGQGSQAGDSMGDYTGAAVDPTDPLTVWVTGEYLKSTTPRGEVPDWGTAIAQLRHGLGTSMSAVFTRPADGETVSGTVPVAMSETGGTGTITWNVRLGGGASPIFSTSGPATTASFNWDTSGVAPGAHTLQLTVQDGAGGTATATLNVIVTGPLTASFSSPAAGTAVSCSVPVSRSEAGGTVT